jgi:uncharacterized membrane protein YgaE (UPF0421/DUF939 family)
LLVATLFITIGFTLLFNICIFPTKFVLKILHKIQINIKTILFWIKKKTTKKVIIQTLDSIKKKPLMKEDINKINKIQDVAKK